MCQAIPKLLQTTSILLILLQPARFVGKNLKGKLALPLCFKKNHATLPIRFPNRVFPNRVFPNRVFPNRVFPNRVILFFS